MEVTSKHPLNPEQKTMADLWRNGQLCDAKVVSCDGTSFDAHRLVLASTSDYMRALLAEDRFKDSSDHTIQLADVSDRAVGYLLEWMYTGICKIASLADVVEFLEAACRLQCQSLIKQLELAICSSVDAGTCLGFWSLAEKLSLDELAKKAKAAAVVGFSSIASSEEFVALTLERIIELTQDDGLVVRKEEEVYESVLKWTKAQHIALSKEEQEKLHACVRYPLMNKKFIMDHVLMEPLLVENPICFRAVLKSFYVDGCSKPRHGQDVPVSWDDVRVGLNVRITNDVEELERLCGEIAPGAIEEVGWATEMAAFAGECFTIDPEDEILAQYRGVALKCHQVEDEQERFFLPFTAFFIA